MLTALRDNVTLEAGRELAQAYAPSNYELTGSIERAEIILYLEYGYVGLTHVPEILRRVRQAPAASHFLFCESDWPFPVLPGAYPSLERRHADALSWCYMPKLSTEISVRAFSALKPKYRFSFLGRVQTHPVRTKLLQLDTEDSPCMDLSQAPGKLQRFEYSTSYWRLIFESKFVLCPRGFGASSIRVYEAMAAGRVPVIISDRWQRPPGIRWDSFCVFVCEDKVGSIPTLLPKYEDRAGEMGKIAQRVFNEHFAPPVFFDQLLRVMESKFENMQTAPATLSRAWRNLGWREIKTLGSQGKALTLKSIKGLTSR